MQNECRKNEPKGFAQCAATADVAAVRAYNTIRRENFDNITVGGIMLLFFRFCSFVDVLTRSKLDLQQYQQQPNICFFCSHSCCLYHKWMSLSEWVESLNCQQEQQQQQQPHLITKKKKLIINSYLNEHCIIYALVGRQTGHVCLCIV